jgi:dethiobiotin synthetase
MAAFFITGTDTGVGKTFFSCWLLRQWKARGFRPAGLKPVSTGDREDARLLAEASGELSLDEVNPTHLREPAAPLVAARAENRVLDFTEENHRIRKLLAPYPHALVEGVGGWRVPLAPGYEVRDWARDLGYPVVVVGRNQLGTLNHTLLTVDSIRASGLTCAGVILNSGPGDSPHLDLARRTHLGLLRELLLLPVFDFDRGAETAGKVPVWLGGEEV